ncbi:MAG: phosphatase PAP2 family protein, partial [Thermomicrobiales bacterium]
YDVGTTHWYDVAAVIVYGLHFVFPLVFGFMVWVGSKERFWQFSLAFLAMTYAGFIIFLLFPAAPPWLADQWGYVSGVQFPSAQAVNALLPRDADGINAIKLWTHASPNPVAAVPSLHASFPWLVLLFSVRFFGKKGLIFLLYNATVWFSVVYLGHHWVVDIFAGIVWATLWYAAIVLLWPRIARGFNLPMPAWLGNAGRRVQSSLPAPWRRSSDSG